MRTPLSLLSLCSGIGGIDYVWSHLLKQEIAGQIENDPYCQAVLQKQWPDVMKRSDIREVRGDEFGAIDLVAGGIPCQPFSVSGQRRGTDDDRHLWPAALPIIERCRPTWVLIENVAGFISLALDLVQTDLERAGYTTQAYVLPACAVGAPHIRERVFIVAHATGWRRGAWRTQLTGQHRSGLADGNGPPRVADSCCSRCGQWTHQSKCESQCNGTSDTCDDGTQGCMAHSNRQRQQECNTSSWSNPSGLVTRCADSDVAHTDGQRGPLPTAGRDATKQIVECTSPGQSQPRMGRDPDGLACRLDSHRWPSPPNKAQEEWEPPRTIAHKLKHRASRLKALGNAVVPQQVYPILKAIVEIEQAYEEMSA